MDTRPRMKKPKRWWKIILLILLGSAALLAGLLRYGAFRWQAATQTLQARLSEARISMEPQKFDPEDMAGLPSPVARYFRTVLPKGQPLIASVRLEHEGTFNPSEDAERWVPFTSTQQVVTRRPGFLWDARIRMMPGVAVRVHDAYIRGEGLLHASIFGLITLANLRGISEIAQGELLRYLAEAAWYPTALLPGQGVGWEEEDDTSARVTLQDGETSAALLVRFNDRGLIQSVRADVRGRALAGRVIPTPWEGRWMRYELRNGLLVPTEGEVAWALPGGPKPYWRGRITKLSYEFAR